MNNYNIVGIPVKRLLFQGTLAGTYFLVYTFSFEL